MDKTTTDPTQPRTGETVPSATRATLAEMDKQQAKSKQPPIEADDDAQTHMGASEDQIIPEKPPTGALTDVLGGKPGDPTSDDGLTPG